MKEVILHAHTVIGGFKIAPAATDLVVDRRANDEHTHRVTCIAGRLRRSVVIKMNPPYSHAEIEKEAEEKFRSHFGLRGSMPVVVRTRITSTTIKPVKAVNQKR